MNPGIYNDLAKPTADFIKKDFPETFKLEGTLKTKFGSFVGTTDISKNGTVLGSVQPKFDLGKYLNKPSSANFTVDTNNVKKGEFTFENLVPGLKAIINADAKQNASAEFQYKKDKLALTLVGKNDKSYITSVAFAVNPTLTLGVQADGNAKTTLKNVNATVVIRPRSDLFFTVSDRFFDKQIIISALYKATPRLSVAGDVTVDLKAGDKSPSFNVGTQYLIDSTSSIKAKFNNSKKVNLAYLVAFSPSAKASFGWNIDARNLKENNTFGANFNFTF